MFRVTGRAIIDPEASVFDADLSRESTVDRVEVEKVGSAFETALDLIDVREMKFRVLA